MEIDIDMYIGNEAMPITNGLENEFAEYLRSNPRRANSCLAIQLSMEQAREIAIEISNVAQISRVTVCEELLKGANSRVTMLGRSISVHRPPTDQPKEQILARLMR